jgi:hypothetical protein
LTEFNEKDEVMFRVNQIRNPPYMFQTGLFKIEIFKENSTQILAMNDDIHGIHIKSGIIDQVKLQKISSQNDFSSLSFDLKTLKFSNILKCKGMCLCD